MADLRHPIRLAALTLLVTLASAWAASVQARGHEAKAYPEKPVRIIVPLATGGGSDIVARILAIALAEHWKQSVVVDNRPGAGSLLGTAIAAKAPRDGYTLLVSSSSIAITPALGRPFQ